MKNHKRRNRVVGIIIYCIILLALIASAFKACMNERIIAGQIVTQTVGEVNE